MSDNFRIHLRPLGETVVVDPDARLQDALFARGIEFPCGARGRCRGCRVKLLQGSLAAGPDEQRMLTRRELDDGWRLACRVKVQSDLTLEVAQWETAILADNTNFAFTSQEGLSIAVDLGTTTLVAQLLDLETGQVRAVQTALNPQAAHGSDVMSRIEVALDREGLRKLRDLIRRKIGLLVSRLLMAVKAEPGALRQVVIVGNTLMHHLFCGISVEPLSHAPFRPLRDGEEVFTAGDLGWKLAGSPRIMFLPCVGGFVGSDILAGVLATGMHESSDLVALVDLGTNGEIVLGNRDKILCASTAAGPAFEAGRISCGMRATTGAITEVCVKDGRLSSRVLGDVEARGICGSGLVDAIAGGLNLGLIQANGRLVSADRILPLTPTLALTQRDVRELQLAKAAIAAGLSILLRLRGAQRGDITRLYLAGAFGNYINRASARRIGLLSFPEDIIEPAGNTALLGAKLALFTSGGRADELVRLRSCVDHVSLAADPQFEDIYVGEMAFPS